MRFTALVCVVYLGVTPIPAFAQAPAQSPALPAGALTLEQVLELAEPRSDSIAAARAGVSRAEADRIRARSGLLPQLSAVAGYDRALASEFDGIFEGGGGPQCDPFTLNPQAALDARVAEIERAIDCGAVGGFFGGGTGSQGGDGLGDLPFGRVNTWRASLAFSQNIFSGGRNGAQIRLSDAGRESAELALTGARGQLLFEATQAYYDAALSERLVGIAEATLEQAGATLRQVQAGFEAGTQPEFEVLRARVNRDNQSPVVIRQRVNREVAMLRLKQLLDLPAEYELRLADSLGDESLAPPPIFASRVASIEGALQAPDAPGVAAQTSVTPPPRTVVAEASAVVRQREAALSLAAAQRMPSVALTSTYTRVAYPSDVFPTFDSGTWRTNWSVGASVSVPIMTGGRLRGDQAVARAELEQARAQHQQVLELAEVDSRAAWAELVAARAAWEATAGTVQQASRAYEIANVRYQSGVSTQLELADSRLLLQQAEANRALAARDLQVARARVALLPDLPLGTGTGGAAPRVPQQAPQVPAQPQAPANPQLRNAAAQGATLQTGTR